MTRHSLDTSLARQLEESTPEEKVDLLFAYLRVKGRTHYDEQVTQLEHALQTAALAKAAGASSAEVTSALLHDLGHLLVDEHDGDSDFLAEDCNHEALGAQCLKPFFPPAVTVPIKLHVPAKRYLCTVDETYYHQLSAASKRSLEVQGGKMNEVERAEFELTPQLESVLRLRRWDDGGKRGGWIVPDLEAYRQDLLACLLK